MEKKHCYILENCKQSVDSGITNGHRRFLDRTREERRVCADTLFKNMIVNIWREGIYSDQT